MSWKGGYYYRSVRCGDRVASEYLGRGPEAEAAALLDGERRARRTAARAVRRRTELAERRTFQAAHKRGAGVERALSAGLAALGWHRPQRHTWRRRRGGVSANLRTFGPPAAEAAEAAEAELRTFVQTAADGIASSAPVDWDEVRVKTARLRGEIEGPNPGPALRLAAQAVLWAWLEYWTVELSARAVGGRGEPAAHFDRRRAWAQRRFASALRTAESIRRLSRPQVLTRRPVPATV